MIRCNQSHFETIWKVNYDSSWEGENYIFRGTVILEYFNKWKVT